jgi:aminoglycoside phosphotransferase (APT) family kinase protein
MASNTERFTAEVTQAAQDTEDEVPKSPTQSHSGSGRSRSSSSASSPSDFDGSSDTSTIKYCQEPHEQFSQFSQRVQKLCQFLWSPERSIKYRFSNSQAVSRLRLNKFLRFIVPSSQTPLIERLRGGDYNRVTGITLPLSYTEQERKLILRTPREEGTRPDRDVAILDYVRQRSSIPVATIAANDFSSDNPLGQPYVFQHRIPGTDLNLIWEELNHSQRCTVARELGNVIRTLLSMESPFTGIVDAKPNNADIVMSPTIVPFELKSGNGDLLEDQYPQNPSETGAPRTRQTTIDFFRSQFARWRAYAVDRNGGDGNHQTDFIDSMLKVAQEMDDLGLFKTDMNCLCHVDLHTRNIMVEVQPDSTLKVTAILDWDEAIFAPKIVACKPPGWLWGYDVNGQTGELTWPFEQKGANDLPSTPESQELKHIFEAYAGPEYPNLAYDDTSRLGRGLFRVAQLGLGDTAYYNAGERIIEEWEALRQSLTQI